ncbi:MAG: hypothetical protein WD065_19185 [Planctomycetaceae bacterium]
MNVTLLTAALWFSASPTPYQTVYVPRDAFLSAVRGQNSTPYEEIPGNGDPYYSNGSPAIDPNAGTGQVMPYSAAPYTPVPYGDPFLGGAPAQMPFAGAGPFAFGANGPQPYRFGWTSRWNAGYMPKEDASGGLGDFGIFEAGVELEHTSPLPDGWIFSSTPQYDYRDWDGPSGIGLPGSVHRIGWDLELATPGNSPFSVQFGFNPSVNSDFDGSTNSDAWNFDGRAIMFLRTSDQLMWALGAGYWDRVDDIVIPYAGLVWTPNDIWEWRLVFPQPRVSVFLGNPMGVATWLYASAEYHVESYQIELQPISTGEKIQIADWRAVLGLRSDNGFISSFIEAGWVFDRQVEFKYTTPDFDISSGLIGRVGIRY